MLPRDLLDRFEHFAWGERDCVHFAAAAREYFGAPAVQMPAYQTEAEAREIIASAGGLRKMLADRLGESVDPSKAQTGDTVFATFPSHCEIVGVACPPHFWLLAEKDGFVPVSLTLANEVWPCRV